MENARLIIENFAGIKSAKIDINDVTILIGPQASGKSVIAKLVYFFNDFFNILALFRLKPEIISTLSRAKSTGDFLNKFGDVKVDIFKSFFPPESWPREFSIRYEHKYEQHSTIILEKQYSDRLKLKIDVEDRYLRNFWEIVKNQSYYKNIDFHYWETKEHLDQLRTEIAEKESELKKIQILEKQKSLKEFSNEKAKNIKDSPEYRELTIERGKIVRQIEELVSKYRKEMANLKKIEEFLALYRLYKVNSIFIPASRSFFALLKESYFKLLEANITMDPFIINFGKNWEYAKLIFQQLNFSNLLKKFLNANYIQEEDAEFLLHDDLRKVPLFMSSSGQQELLPVLMVLLYLKTMRNTDSAPSFVFFEEPETHLFPETQKHLVEFLAEVFNSSERLRFFITTHSPYILTSFNNLIYAAYISKKFGKSKTKLAELKKIVPQNRWISPDRISTYAVDPNKGIYKIQEEETGLISQTVLDEISDKISMEFEKLLNIEFNDAR